jgi:DNA (cytosine-5)-methyltransferase 1
VTLGSLFAGIGGFDLGFERAGMTTAWQVEIDKAARGVLERRFPHATRYEDIAAVGAHNLEPVDVICGGFPCQDLSVAGKRAGLAGERSGLFHEMVRVTDELKPDFLVWENVPGLLSSHRGRDFGIVLDALDRIGYSGAWTILDARYFGVAQRRRRVFGVFARGDSGTERCAEILALSERLRGNPAPRRQARKGTASTLAARTRGGGGLGTDLDLDGGLVADPISAREATTYAHAGNNCGRLHNVVPRVEATCTAGAHPGSYNGQDAYADGHLIPFDTAQITSADNRSNPQPGAPSHPITAHGHAPAIAGQGVRRLTPRECERLQGFPDDWTEVQANGPRYRQLGNAVAVPCAEWIGRRLMAVSS